MRVGISAKAIAFGVTGNAGVKSGVGWSHPVGRRGKADVGVGVGVLVALDARLGVGLLRVDEGLGVTLDNPLVAVRVGLGELVSSVGVASLAVEQAGTLPTSIRTRTTR
jgi:hypothetical protein